MIIEVFIWGTLLVNASLLIIQVYLTARLIASNKELSREVGMNSLIRQWEIDNKNKKASKTSKK